MAKIAIVGDLHIGARNGSEHLLEFQHEWLKRLLDTCKEKGIDTIIQLGDFFDVRLSTKNNIMWYILTEFKELVMQYDIDWHVLVGNHDIFYKHSNKIYTSKLLESKDFDGKFKVYSKSQDVKVCGLDILMLPWLDEVETLNLESTLKNSKSKVAVGHLEIIDAQMYTGIIGNVGMNANTFKQFDKVLSGHYHCISQIENINYLGSPYHLTWADVKDGTNRGFHILDTDTLELELIKNEEHHSIFTHTTYDETKEYDETYFNNLTGKIVHIVVNEKENNTKFTDYINKVKASNVIDYRVEDNTIVVVNQQDENNDTSIEVGDLLQYMSKYKEENELDSLSTNTIVDVYNEALNNE